MKLSAALLVLTALAVSACEVDTSALQDIQDTAAEVQRGAETINARSAQVQDAIDNPGGALMAAVGATFTRTGTDQPGVYVLTDLQTGCQFLATYAADGTTVSTIAPRVEATAAGGTRQRCVAIPGVARPDEAEAEAEAEG